MASKTLIDLIQEWLEESYGADASNAITQAVAYVIFNTYHRKLRSREDLTPAMVADAADFVATTASTLANTARQKL